jgi:hypothetical protein
MVGNHLPTLYDGRWVASAVIYVGVRPNAVFPILKNLAIQTVSRLVTRSTTISSMINYVRHIEFLYKQCQVARVIVSDDARLACILSNGHLIVDRDQPFLDVFYLQSHSLARSS